MRLDAPSVPDLPAQWSPPRLSNFEVLLIGGLFLEVFKLGDL
jgi:hypothetical protein